MIGGCSEAMPIFTPAAAMQQRPADRIEKDGTTPLPLVPVFRSIPQLLIQKLKGFSGDHILRVWSRASSRVTAPILPG